MNDYIKRASLLDDIIRRYCNDCERRKNANGKTVYAIGDAPCRACEVADMLDAIEDYPVAAVLGEWVSATERLPKRSGAYLVWTQFHFEEFPSINIVNFDSDVNAFGDWHESFDPVSLGSLGSDFETVDVRYWMPLPNPPEEET